MGNAVSHCEEAALAPPVEEQEVSFACIGGWALYI